MVQKLQDRKLALREWALEQRQALSPGEPAWDSLRPLLAALPADAVILTYLASALEMNPAGLNRHTDRRLAVTRTPSKGRLLTLHLLNDGTELERHPFGYMQPLQGTEELAPESIGMALVPGLVFDSHGGRLGYGAGYYDRLLPRLQPGIPLVGVVHSGLVVESVPMGEQDVRMTHLLTEVGLVECGNQR